MKYLLAVVSVFVCLNSYSETEYEKIQKMSLAEVEASEDLIAEYPSMGPASRSLSAKDFCYTGEDFRSIKAQPIFEIVEVVDDLEHVKVGEEFVYLSKEYVAIDCDDYPYDYSCTEDVIRGRPVTVDVNIWDYDSFVDDDEPITTKSYTIPNCSTK